MFKIHEQGILYYETAMIITWMCYQSKKIKPLVCTSLFFPSMHMDTQTVRLPVSLPQSELHSVLFPSTVPAQHANQPAVAPHYALCVPHKLKYQEFKGLLSLLESLLPLRMMNRSLYTSLTK